MSAQPKTSNYYLHYFNANVERRFPHPLAFEAFTRRLIVDCKASGEVFTIVGIGTAPHQCYLWSNFTIDRCEQSGQGSMMLQGIAQQLSPPPQLVDEDIATLINGDFAHNRFSIISTNKMADRFAILAKQNQPPGDHVKLVPFLRQMEKVISTAGMARQIEKLRNSLRKSKPSPVLYSAVPDQHRALSMRQPSAEQILRGTKKSEFRSFATNVRGTVYIYASIKPDLESFKECSINPISVPYGLILGTVEIVDCRGSRDYYEWRLKNPKRFAKPLKPTRQPQPNIWSAF